MRELSDQHDEQLQKLNLDHESQLNTKDQIIQRVTETLEDKESIIQVGRNSKLLNVFVVYCIVASFWGEIEFPYTNYVKALIDMHKTKYFFKNESLRDILKGLH